LMILYFRSSAHMEAAYGFSITIAMLMTTLLLSYFMIYRLKWNKYLVAAILLVFVSVEFSFFVANVAKIKQRWMFLFFELFIFLTMYTWYYSRQIRNRFLKFVDLEKYNRLFITLSNDDQIPKFSTHLIYLTKANNRNEIEEKIVNSIFSKKPKRADVYWFVHLNRTEHPYTLDYDIIELVPDRVIKININVGFRIPPRTELYFKRITQELIANKELNLHTRADGSTFYNKEPDFKFVVIEKFLSVENEFTLREGLLLNAYFLLRRLGQNDERAFGLDKSDVKVEYVPLIYHPLEKIDLKRNRSLT
jgi:KUP system potassium uptake protein